MESRVDHVAGTRKNPRRSRAQQSAASTEAILQAALTCFNRSGSQATSIEDIAKEAGVSRTLVHYHFKTKDDLFLQVQVHLFKAVSDRIQETVARLGPSPTQAGWALDEVWSFMKLARTFFPMFIDQVARSLTDERLKSTFKEQLQGRRQMLMDGIRSVLATSGTELDRRVPAVADLIMAAFAGLPLVDALFGDPARTEAAYREFKDMLLSLSAGPTSTGAAAPGTIGAVRV